jgi:hypothetical protein
MTLRAKIPRILSTYTDVYNPKGKMNMKYFAFSACCLTFLFYRSAFIRSVREMPQGYYFDPENEYSPKIIKMD